MSLPVMPTRILLIGGGGREHALAWKLASEPGVNLVVVAPGSDAIAAEHRVRLAYLDHVYPDAIVDLARAQAIELVIIGPEQPLADGVADALRVAAIPTFGPSRVAARIETSKAFCHEVAAAAGVRMAEAQICRTEAAAIDAVRAFCSTGQGVVIKDDGLAAGKGVSVFDPAYPVNSIVHEVGHLFERSAVVVVEERLRGREATVVVLTDGRDLVALPAARDHKRLRDGDAGPNTGGMGAYSPLPDMPDELVDSIVESVHRPILRELATRGTPFVGALYAGLMLTADGPVLLECNARFGDPETQVQLPRLAVPLGPLLHAAARGHLGAALAASGLAGSVRLPTATGATVGIVLAAERYPAVASRGERVTGLDDALHTGALIFHSGTRGTADGGFETNGGRILTVVGHGRDMAAARAIANAAAEAITFTGVRRRHDIGVDPTAAVPA